MGLFSDPPDDERPDWHPVYPEPSDLWKELRSEGAEFIEEQWDYGYGGESYKAYVINETAIEQFILERERKLLDGKTLEEFLDAKG